MVFIPAAEWSVRSEVRELNGLRAGQHMPPVTGGCDRPRGRWAPQ